MQNAFGVTSAFQIIVIFMVLLQHILSQVFSPEHLHYLNVHI